MALKEKKILSAVADSRQGERNTANFLNQALLARIGALGHGEETVMQARGQIPGMYGGQYATSLGGAHSAMGNATSAAQTPGFGDTFLPAPAGGEVEAFSNWQLAIGDKR